eukprot:SAG11_NODE_1339_length_5169_cov_2.613412_4_plen_233_part_00
MCVCVFWGEGGWGGANANGLVDRSCKVRGSLDILYKACDREDAYPEAHENATYTLFQIQEYTDSHPESQLDLTAQHKEDDGDNFELDKFLCVKMVSKYVAVLASGFEPPDKCPKIQAPEGQSETPTACMITTGSLRTFKLASESAAMDTGSAEEGDKDHANSWYRGTPDQTLALMRSRQANVLFVDVKNATRESALCRVQVTTALSLGIMVVFIEYAHSSYKPEVRAIFLVA